MTEPPAPSDTPIRRGSPFAHVPPTGSNGDEPVPASNSAAAWRAVDSTFEPERGVLRAANWASAWVVLCAVACLQVFPGGGMVVAAWGGGLASIGLFSSRPRSATVLLIIHGGLFFGCYYRLL